MLSLIEKLSVALRDQPNQYHRSEIHFLLGTDRQIGQEANPPTCEKRVGITPDQVGQLYGFARDLGIELTVLVVRGAGVRAGYSDGCYIRAGAEIVTREELPHLDRAPDIVHALKEPSPYEEAIPAPFCRIGALHSGDFDPNTGLARLLMKRKVAVFDGSNIGAGPRIPIRGRMSEFAGRIAARWITTHLDSCGLEGKIVIVGAGYVGQSAAKALVDSPAIREIHVFEDAGQPRRVEKVRRMLQPLGEKVAVFESTDLDHPRLIESLRDDCVGVLLALYRAGAETPKVLSASAIDQYLAEDGIVVDVSIDEKGAIQDPGILKRWRSDDIISHLRTRIGNHRRHVYQAIANMPRALPREASEEHGKAVLPYLAMLIYLSACEDGPEGVVRDLSRLSVTAENPDPAGCEVSQLPQVLRQDLRNGLAFFPRCGRVVVEDIVADRRNILGFLSRETKRNLGPIPFEFSLIRRDDRGKGEAHQQDAFERLPGEVKKSLQIAVNKSLDQCYVIFHPGVDGTRTSDAAEALGVEPDEVLKCLIFKTDDGRFLAAVCTGSRRVDEHRLSELCNSESLEKADPSEVNRITGHSIGGIPLIEIFSYDRISEVFIDENVMERDSVYGSAGSEFWGMKMAPKELASLGGRVDRITEPPNALQFHRQTLLKKLHDLEDAILHENVLKATKITNRIASILEPD